MAEIDKLLANMARKGIQSATLVNGQPMRVHKDGKEAQGATFDLGQLMNMAREIVPSTERSRLATKYEGIFSHHITEGFFSIVISRKGQTLRIQADLLAVSPALVLTPIGNWQPQLYPSAKGHLNEVQDVALSSDGTWLASAAGESINLWESATGRHSSTLASSQESANAASQINLGLYHFGAWSVEFSPNDEKISCGITSGLWTWQTRGGKSFQRLPYHAVRSLAYLPDGSDLVLGTGGDSGMTDKAKSTMKTVAVASSIASVAFGTPNIDSPNDPNGLLQLAGSAAGKFQVWEWGDKPPEAPNDGVVNAVAISADGRYLISGDNWHTVRVFDLGQLNNQATSFVSLKFGSVEKLKKQTSHHSIRLGEEIRSVSCAATDSKVVASCGKEIVLFDAVNAAIKWRQRGNYGKALLSRHGDLVFAASDSKILVLSAQDGQQVHAPLETPAPVSALSTSRDGRTLACGCGDGSLHVWRLW